MGEYSIFVWPCYAATIVLMVGLCFSSWRNKRRNEKMLSELKNQLDHTEK